MMVKRITTEWVSIKNLGMATRIHYPVFAHDWLVKIGRVRFGTLRGRIIKLILKLIGVWQEYRVARTPWEISRLLTEAELEN